MEFHIFEPTSVCHAYPIHESYGSKSGEVEMILTSLTCYPECTLVQAMEYINQNTKGIVFVVDHEQRLLGLLTDGDIRRLLIDGHPLHETVGKLANASYRYATIDQTLEEMVAKLDSRVQILPVIDEQGRVTDIFELSTNISVPIATPDLSGKEISYAVDALLSTWISSKGKYIHKFEQEFAAYCGTSHGVCVANGTVALQLALVALGIGAGDEVIVPDLTFAATINAVLHAGATPVLVDIEHESWCMDPSAIEQAITPKTKAIIPVHLYGQPADMDAITDIARKHKLKIIEDAAEAHGAVFNAKSCGSMGDVGCFSFFGNKVITTGEGGMCVTNDSELADRMRVLRDHGMSRTKQYWHDMVGFNFRMTNIQAAIGCAQLERIDSILDAKKSIEQAYRDCLKGYDFVTFQRNDLLNRERITWLVSILLPDKSVRDEFVKRCAHEKIDLRQFFYPLHQMQIYSRYMHIDCPVGKEISDRGVNLPTNCGMKQPDIERIANVLATL